MREVRILSWVLNLCKHETIWCEKLNRENYSLQETYEYVHFGVLEALDASEVRVEELRQTIAENEHFEHGERIAEQVERTQTPQSPEPRANSVVHTSAHACRDVLGESQQGQCLNNVSSIRTQLKIFCNINFIESIAC